MSAAPIPFDVRAVLFDAVGTLIFPDPTAPEVYSAVARRQGLTLTLHEIRTRFLSAYQAEEVTDRRLGWLTNEERETARWRRIVGETLAGVGDPEACFRELFEHFARPAAWRVNPDVAVVFKFLFEGGLTIGIGSNYDSRLRSILGGIPELAPISNRVIISAAVGFRKPSAQFFGEVARVAGHEPCKVLFVGDDVENDYRGAIAAGFHAVLLDEQNREPTVTKRIRSLGELIRQPSSCF